MDDLYEFFEFQRVGGLDKQLTDSQKISSNKYFMRTRKEANRDVKADNCFICKKPCTSFCNSHSIPTFILTNIAEQGKLFRANIINDNSAPLAEVGVKQAGTFRNICRDCDSTVFQEYENDTAIENSLNNIFLSEIALKNYLNEMYKKSVSVQMFNKMSSFSPMAGSQVYPSSLDALEAEQCANYALRSINGKAKGYYLFFNMVLNYRVPIAFQNRINLVADLCGNMVNNVYNFDNDYTQKSLHICVFPLKEKSIILMFVEEGDKRYSRFRKQFNKLSLDEKLEVINYMLFLYSDDIYISPSICHSVLENENLIDVCSITSSFKISTNKPIFEINPIIPALRTFDLSKRKIIPNFLSTEYSLS